MNDHGFRSLMKTGRPEYHIPSQQTLSCNVQNAFVQVHGRITKLLQVRNNQIVLSLCAHQSGQEYDGKLNFATDAWTSPNHKAYVAITVHLERDGKPMAWLLDIVKVPKSHTGTNLALEFTKVLNNFRISDKVRLSIRQRRKHSHTLNRFLASPLTTCQTTTRCLTS